MDYHKYSNREKQDATNAAILELFETREDFYKQEHFDIVEEGTIKKLAELANSYTTETITEQDLLFEHSMRF